MGHSAYLSSLNNEARQQLEARLHARQSGVCFICDKPIDLKLQKGQLDIDHIDPLAKDGLDAENNFALTHASCNRSKGAANLEVARRLAEFEELQEQAARRGQRGANLGDVLARHAGSVHDLQIVVRGDEVRYSLAATGDNTVRSAPLHADKLSGMRSFFAQIPIEYLWHDDRINPRAIGSNIRGLIEEFRERRPQLHVALAWWAPEGEGPGKLKVFDGQHKAAAQVLLGVRELLLRVFVQPDTNVLLQANTNAGGTLRQVAFDTAVMRHLGNTLYLERIASYRQGRGLAKDDYSFSEQDLVKWFRGERREMERYIIDSQRDAVMRHADNKIIEFVEWSGKSADRPLSYNAIERTFFKEFLYKKALDSRLDDGVEQGMNPRQLEREQLARIMSLFAEVYFVGHWDPDLGGRQLESRFKSGEKVPVNHLRAWRIAREEVLANVLRYARLVVTHFFAHVGQAIQEDRLLHRKLPDDLWKNLRHFFESMSRLPCWIDPQLGATVFGPKQNLDFWERVFDTGVAPGGQRVLAEGLNVTQMIRGGAPGAR